MMRSVKNRNVKQTKHISSQI